MSHSQTPRQTCGDVCYCLLLLLLPQTIPPSRALHLNCLLSNAVKYGLPLTRCVLPFCPYVLMMLSVCVGV
uniref:Putative secreted protein n=1 Tax=Anopheles marajoara TaxID=58244 RepID=A0A2M4CF92_9DIPT